MKFLLAILIAFASFHFDSKAEEQNQAPKEVIEEIKLECIDYAKEDEVSKEEMQEYMLNCVNEELLERGFAEIDKLK